MSKMYYIMNKDSIIGKIRIKKDNSIELVNHSKLPKFLSDKNRWAKHRFGIKKRQSLLFSLDAAKYESLTEIYDTTYMVSINDTMWLKGIDSNTNWNDVNPYKNAINNKLADLCMYGVDKLGQLRDKKHYRVPNPQITLDGTADKCVKRLNGKLVLQKIDIEDNRYGNRQHSEYVASEFRKLLKIPGVNYRIRVIKDYIMSECDVFTDENTGFIAAGDTKLGDCSIDELIEKLDDNGKLQINQMMILDALIINIDRHRWNYGFLFDNDTFEIKGLAPIFDNDMSLLAMDSINYELDFDYIYPGVKYRTSRQGKTNFYDNMAVYNYAEIYDKIIKLEGKVNIKHIKNANANRHELLNKVLNKRINEYRRLLNGECIYEQF